MRSTASLPAGTIAPVEIFTAWPLSSCPPYGSAGPRLPRHRQRHGSSLGRRGGVGGARGKAIHRGIVEAGYVVVAHDVLGQDVADGVTQRHRFAGAGAARRRISPLASCGGMQAGGLLWTASATAQAARAASSARSVSRPPTLSGSFAASTAPSTASRGSPGALLVSARRRPGERGLAAWVTGTVAAGRRRAGRLLGVVPARDFGRAALRR